MNTNKNIFVLADDNIYDLNIKSIRDYITSKSTSILSKQENNYRPSTLANKLYSNATLITVETLVNLSHLTNNQIELLFSLNKEYILFILYLSYFNMINEEETNQFFTLLNNSSRDKFILKYIGYSNDEYIIDEEDNGIIKYSFMESFDRALNEGKLQTFNNYSETEVYNFNEKDFSQSIKYISKELFLFDEVPSSFPVGTINNQFNSRLELTLYDTNRLFKYFDKFYSENPFSLKQVNSYSLPSMKFNLIPIDFLNKHSIRCAYNKFLNKSDRIKRIHFLDKQTQKSLLLDNVINSNGFLYQQNTDNKDYIKIEDRFLCHNVAKYLSSNYYLFSMLDMSYDASLYLYLKQEPLEYKNINNEATLDEFINFSLKNNSSYLIDSYDLIINLLNYSHVNIDEYKNKMSDNKFSKMNYKSYTNDGSSAGENIKYELNMMKPRKGSAPIANSYLIYDRSKLFDKFSSHSDDYTTEFASLFDIVNSPIKEYYSLINNKDISINNKDKIINQICPQYYYKSLSNKVADRRYILYLMAKDIFNELLFVNKNDSLNIISIFNKLLYKLDPNIEDLTKEQAISQIETFINDSALIDIDIRLDELNKKDSLDMKKIKNCLINLNKENTFIKDYITKLRQLFKDAFNIEIFNKIPSDTFDYDLNDIIETEIPVQIPSIKIFNLGSQFKTFSKTFMNVITNCIIIPSSDMTNKNTIETFNTLGTIKKYVINKTKNSNIFTNLTEETVDSCTDITSILYYYFTQEPSIIEKFYFMLMTDLFLNYCDYLDNDYLNTFELEVNYYTYIVYRAIFLIRESLIDFASISFNTDKEQNKIIQNINKNENNIYNSQKLFTKDIPIYKDDLTPEEFIGTLYEQFKSVIKGDGNNV